MNTQSAAQRTYNFSAGPAALPLPVLEQAREELLCLPGVGASILEISHRSEAFIGIMNECEARLRSLLDIPQNYRVLFLQGGSRLQFSMVPMNLMRSPRATADYILTGSWGEYALAEAEKRGAPRVAWRPDDNVFNRLPPEGACEFSREAEYVHITSNETIQGVQFPADPPACEAPLVCDSSSDFMCRPTPVGKFGVIYACAQKNAGPAGVTIVIIRDDLLERSDDRLPGYLNYRSHAENQSLYNTPPTFGIYIVGLVARWLQEEVGGLAAMHQRNREKASLLYEVLDESPEFYRGHAQPEARSLMNVTFRLPSDQLQAEFLAAAAEHGMTDLKGHRSVGGVRASIYNAMPREGVESLRAFMRDFRDRHAE